MSNIPGILNEEYLLLQLCRTEFTGVHISKINEATESITDWNYFRHLANIHGIEALVWHNLEKYNLIANIPENIAALLKSSLMINLSRNTFNAKVTAEVLALLNRKNIRTVLLKGMALENSVYGNEGLRQMSDIDVLTSPQHCLKAGRILKEEGYEPLPPKSVIHKLIQPYYGKHLPSYIKNGASVEIHFDLFGRKHPELTENLYRTSYEAIVCGEKGWIPSPQIFFLYLVRHLHMHELDNESQLRLYTDLVVMIEKYHNEILNTNLIRFAVGSGQEKVLASYLFILREIWEINYPDRIVEFINEFELSNSLPQFYFFLKSPKGNPPADKPASYRRIVKEIPGIHRKILFVLGDTFPDIRFMKKRYNCSSALKAIFYYPHRLGKILWLTRKSHISK